MADTMQQDKEKIIIPEIRDTADSYADYTDDYTDGYTDDISDDQGAATVDVDIDDMVWEVETEPSDYSHEDRDSYSEEVYNTSSAEEDRSYSQDNTYAGPQYERYEEIPYARKMNKHLFTWILSCAGGMYGLDRFFRGQIGLGLLKLFTFGGFGMWYLADMGIAFYKSYLEPDAVMQDDLHFDSYGRYV